MKRIYKRMMSTYIVIIGVLVLTSCVQKDFLRNNLNLNTHGYSNVDKKVDKKVESERTDQCNVLSEPCIPLDKVMDVQEEPWATITKLRDTADQNVSIVIQLREDSSMVSAMSHTIVIDQGALHTYGTRGLIGAVAHELGHIILGHKNKRSYYQKMLKATVLGSTLIDDDAAFRSLLVSRITDSIMSATWKKDQELEADKKAIEILVNTGIDPRSVIFAFTKKAAQIEALVEKNKTSLERFLNQLVSLNNNKGVVRIELGIGLSPDERHIYSEFLKKIKSSQSDPTKFQLMIAGVEGINRLFVDLSSVDHPTVQERNNEILKELKKYKNLNKLAKFKSKSAVDLSGFCLSKSYFTKNQNRCIKRLSYKAKQEPLYYYILVRMMNKKHDVGASKKIKWLEKSINSALTPDRAWEMLSDAYYRNRNYELVIKLANKYKNKFGENKKLPQHLLLASLAAKQRIGKGENPLVCYGEGVSNLSVSAYNQCVAASRGNYQPVY